MAFNAANLALDGGDPRLHDGGTGGNPAIRRASMHKLHDKTIPFEEYLHYARITRAEQDNLSSGPGPGTTMTSHEMTVGNHNGFAPGEKEYEVNGNNNAVGNGNAIGKVERGREVVSEDEWVTASRALRTASWLAVFYLITTDILGPYGVPFAMGTLGWGPGVALYFVFGLLAALGGLLLWDIFLALDSHQFPLHTYGDLAFRLYGSLMRHLINILQSIQLVFNVGIIIISNGQALSQISSFKLCYAVCCIVWAIAGFVIGQVRTLKNYGWLANCAIWLNVLIMIFTMAVVAHSGVNYDATGGAAGTALGGDSVTADPTSGAYPPVQTFAGMPPSTVGFTGAIVGLMQAVYAYGGAMLFVEFMAEMRRPRDFWKAMVCAQSFIFVCYLFFGCFVYAFQGQYSVNPAYQGVAPYAWQTVGNVLAIVSALIAAGLYGNIGIKVLYANIFQEFFHAPPLTARRGKIIWALVTPIYWSLAYIIAAAIPNFFALSSLIAALCIMQFSYTFPPLLHLAYHIRRGAMLPGEGFDLQTGALIRHDRGMGRLVRGFLAKGYPSGGGVLGWRTWLNVFNIIFFLGSLATAALGAYSAIEALIEAFSHPSITAFTCTSPLAPVS